MDTTEKLKKLWENGITKDGWGYDILEADLDGILKLTSEWIDKNFIPVEAGVSLQKAEDDNYKKVFEKYGETHLIEKRMGTSVDITKLKDNESVCWGDGMSYHFLLTKK